MFELYEGGGSGAEFAEQFAASWHRGDWHQAENHWELLVNRLLQGSEMEGLKLRDALRRAEQEAQNLGLLLLRSTQTTRCPICAVTPQPSRPDVQRPTMEPR
ncbi:DUF6313 family protein [Streptomyces sp. NPDC006627]|uniref:DUF6313 family protein n=1 Tax=Streptomyces sp. NPDC006627 TaxID=3154679 RepID=UPI0033A3EFB2